MTSEQFPVIVKIGRGHKGLGKIKVDDPVQLMDINSLTSVMKEDVILEQFIDSKYDVHVQKIGSKYKAFIRKGISSHWKANIGSSMLEQVALTERYKIWIDEVAQLFGGLEICAVKAVVAKNGKEVIFEVADCSFTLLGETQEEDRHQIADLAMLKLNHIVGTQLRTAQLNAQSAKNSKPHPLPPRPIRQPSKDVQKRRDSSSKVDPGPATTNDDLNTQDDTMGQLKKTFAGIFRDM